MIPSSENHDRELKENEFADAVGRRIIFLGFVDRKGSKKIKYVYGSQVVPSFKEKVCNTAMDIILSDPDIRLLGNILQEDIDI